VATVADEQVKAPVPQALHERVPEKNPAAKQDAEQTAVMLTH